MVKIKKTPKNKFKIWLATSTKSKKAAVFTIAAIVIATLILSTYFALLETPLNEKTKLTRTRIRQSDFYLDQIHYFTKETLRQSTEGTINGMIDYMKTNEFFDPEDFDENLKGCLTGNITADYCTTSLQGALDEFSRYGRENIGFNSLDVKIKDENQLRVYQDTPWDIKADVNLTIEANDGYAQWNMDNLTITAEFPIFGMRDPTYFIDNNNPESVAIMASYADEDREIFTIKIDELEINTAFNDYINTTAYFKNSQGVSYMDRLRNAKQTSECCGIASFLSNEDVNESQQFTQTYKENYGNMDYLFFKQYGDIGPWSLEKYDFWNQEDGQNYRLPTVRNLHNIDNVTGENLNGSIMPEDLWQDVYLTEPSAPNDYTYIASASCDDNICQYIETCATCPEDCGIC